MRILQFGDNHFEESSPRWSECLRVHGRVVEEVRRLQPDLILDGGDLVTKRTTTAERNAVASFLAECAEVAPLVITGGNHDPDEEWNFILPKLGTKHPIHVVTDARVIDVAGASIACVAWPTRAGPIDDGAAREDLRATLTHLGLELATRKGPRLALGHFDCDGAVAGTGQPLIGGSVRVSLADLGRLNAQIVFMSHIHKPQEWMFGDVPLLYAGSLFRTDWGETEAKSFVLAEVDAEGVRWERIDTGARAMVDGTAVWDNDAPGWDWETEPLGLVDVAQADVRFSYTVPAEHLAVARREAASLEARLLAAGAATVKIDAQAEATTRARAPEVAEARTIPAQMEALWKATNNVPEEPMKTLLLEAMNELLEPRAA